MKYIMKAGSPPGYLALLVGAMLLGLVSQSVLAVGTTTGTSISNTATLSYTVGGVDPTGGVGIASTSAAFVVDAKINLTVAGTGVAIPVIPGSSAQVATFTVTNNANNALDFTLAANQPVGGTYLTLTDTFDATACSSFVESGANAGYQAAQDTATYIDELPAAPAVGSTKTVYVVCNIPTGLSNTDNAIVGMTATAAGTFNAAGYVATVGAQGAVITQTAGADTAANVDIVFADSAGSEGDGARDKAHSARDVFQVQTAALTVTKTAVLLCDPLNGNGPTSAANPKNIPGAITQWNITVSNAAGGAAATLTTISDALSATLAHDANLVTGLSAAACDSTTGVPESAAGRGFKVTVPVARVLGGSLAGSGTTSYFTTASDADGVELAASTVTATFATILPIDGATGHATAGLLNANESVSIIFNTTVQ